MTKLNNTVFFLLSLVALALPANAQQVLRSQTMSFDNITALEAVPFSYFQTGAVVLIVDAARAGEFIKVATDQTALATNDPQKCVFIPSPQDATGASGGWMRKDWMIDKVVDPQFCGAVIDDGLSDQTAMDAAAALTKAFSPSAIRLPCGELNLTATWTLTNDGLTIKGCGPNSSVIEGNFAAGDVIHINGPGAPGGDANNYTLEDFSIESSVQKTSGAGLHAQRLVRSNITRVYADGQDGPGNLYNGYWFNLFDQISMTQFESEGNANDALIANGGGSGGNLNLSHAKIASNAVGLRFAGDCGGCNVTHVDFNNNTTAQVIIDQSIVSSGNRQIKFGTGVAFDGQNVGAPENRIGTGLIINDPDLDTLALHEVFISVNEIGIDLQAASDAQTEIYIADSTIKNADSECVKLQTTARLFVFANNNVEDCVGGGLISTVDWSNKGPGEGIFVYHSNRFRNNNDLDIDYQDIPPLVGASWRPKIADDQAYCFKPRDDTSLGSAGLAFITQAVTNTRAFFFYRATSGGSNILTFDSNGTANAATSGFTLTTGTLTGTTGVDGEQTISAHTDERICIENRSNAQRTYYVSLLGGSPEGGVWDLP